jgi:hypothetical protein
MIGGLARFRVKNARECTETLIMAFFSDVTARHDVCHPIGVEVYRPDPALLEGWAPPQRAAYRNVHGLHAPRWGEE